MNGKTTDWNPAEGRLQAARLRRFGLLALAGLALLAGGAPWRQSPAPAGGPALFDRVDVNRDPWPSLARLEGVGRTLAIRIVDYRLAAGPGAPPFGCVEDLQRVSGLGPAKTERMRAGVYCGPAPASQLTKEQN